MRVMRACLGVMPLSHMSCQLCLHVGSSMPEQLQVQHDILHRERLPEEDRDPGYEPKKEPPAC